MTQILIINEQHTLLPQQRDLIDENFETLSVPADGWSHEEMLEVCEDLCRRAKAAAWGFGKGPLPDGPVMEVVFASPVPAMLLILARWSGIEYGALAGGPIMEVRVLHNDNREKKELPNGKVVYTVAKDGWQLV